jgi:hypothetical protein
MTAHIASRCRLVNTSQLNVRAFASKRPPARTQSPSDIDPNVDRAQLVFDPFCRGLHRLVVRHVGRDRQRPHAVSAQFRRCVLQPRRVP